MTHSAVDNALNVARLAKTVAAARRFDRSRELPSGTDGQSYWNMRQAMSLDPRVGKAVSKFAFRSAPPMAWDVADTASTRFIDAAEVDAAVAGIRRDGLYVFSQVVDGSVVEAIRSFAEQVPCTARGEGSPKAAYPRSAPTAGRYDIGEEDALVCAEVQEFATDPLMALIAQRYLDQPVIMDEIAFWWTTPQRGQDADLNAQLFHQDRDRLSFLKFFIYLTDVSPDTGPHVYLRGSHKRIPWSLRADGRMTDDAVRAAGLWEDVLELNGPAGTIMAVDTIGLHKGKTPISGDRLALENEFSTSLFGMEYERPSFEPTDLVRERYLRMPYTLQRYRDAVVRSTRA